jgi:hypothetical protein
MSPLGGGEGGRSALPERPHEGNDGEAATQERRQREGEGDALRREEPGEGGIRIRLDIEVTLNVSRQI